MLSNSIILALDTTIQELTQRIDRLEAVSSQLNLKLQGAYSSLDRTYYLINIAFVVAGMVLVVAVAHTIIQNQNLEINARRHFKKRHKKFIRQRNADHDNVIDKLKNKNKRYLRELRIKVNRADDIYEKLAGYDRANQLIDDIFILSKDPKTHMDDLFTRLTEISVYPSEKVIVALNTAIDAIKDFPIDGSFREQDRDELLEEGKRSKRRCLRGLKKAASD